MKKYTTLSDVGSVVIGSKDMLFHIANGLGDGETHVEIINEGEKVTDPRDFVTRVSGNFNLYRNDCSTGALEDVVATLSGVYNVYAHNGRVVFEKQEADNKKRYEQK